MKADIIKKYFQAWINKDILSKFIDLGSGKWLI